MIPRFDDVEPLRRRIMSAVRGRDTKPEMVARQLLHAMNFRYRLHRKDLPGNPDIMFGRTQKAIFVHGCFWHRHPRCSKATSPETRSEFWIGKFARNVERDREVQLRLNEMSWQSQVAWECEMRTPEVLAARLKTFLGGPSAADGSDRTPA